MIINATAYWAKVGKPVKGFNAGEFEWSVDAAQLSAATVKKLKELGVGDRIKNKGDDRGDFISFRRKTVKVDGTPAKPFDLVDAQKNEWDRSVKIGNGSKVNAKFVINDRPGGKKTASLIGLQIVELVPYEGTAEGDFEDFPTVGENGVETWD